MRPKVTKFLYVAFLIFVLCGCGKNIRSYLKPHSELQVVRKAAILPFDNVSGQAEAGEKVKNSFLSQMYNLGRVEIMESGEIDKFLWEERIRSTAQVDLKIIQKLRTKFGVDAIVLGSVDEYGYLRLGNEESPVVAISLRIIDTSRGKILFAASHSRAGNDRETIFGMGKIRTLSRLTEIVVSELINPLRSSLPRLGTGPAAAGGTVEILPREPVSGEHETTEEKEVPSMAAAAEPAQEIVPEPVEKTKEELKAEFKELYGEYFQKIKGEAPAVTEPATQ